MGLVVTGISQTSDITALEAALVAAGFSLDHVQLIEPGDDTATLAHLTQSHHALIIVEEHVPTGGLWSAVCQWVATVQEKNCRLIRLGPPDAFILGNPKREELRSRYGFDSVAITQMCQKLMN